MILVSVARRAISTSIATIKKAGDSKGLWDLVSSRHWTARSKVEVCFERGSLNGGIDWRINLKQTLIIAFTVLKQGFIIV